MVSDDEHQLDLFPRATQKDIQRAKMLLANYRRMKATVEALERLRNLTPKQQLAYDRYQTNIQLLEQAVSLILDQEVKRVIDYRFLKGQRHKDTIIHFRSIMSDRTVDRRIQDGIISVANTLKLIGE